MDTNFWKSAVEPGQCELNNMGQVKERLLAVLRRYRTRKVPWRFFAVVSLLCVGSVAALPAQAPTSKSHSHSKSKPAASSGPSTPSPAATPPAGPAAPPADPLGRTTPRGCILGFLRAAGAEDYARAAKYLDSNAPEQKSEELALQLKLLLDRDTSMNILAVSRAPEGNRDEAARIGRERVTTITVPWGSLQVLLDRVQRPDQAPIWLFSQETLKDVPAAYASMQQRGVERYFPAWSSRVRFLSIPLWRWTLALLSLAAGVIAARILSRVLLWGIQTSLRRKLDQGIRSAVLALNWPLFGVLLAVAFHIGGLYSLTLLGRHLWESISTIVGLVSGAWLLIKLSDVVASYLRYRLTLQMHLERVTVVAFLVILFKIAVGMVLVVVLMKQAGVDVSTVIAGLGIGGIALALAAQETLANLFGGISVVMRGAVRVGDMCNIAGQMGTVEEIGMSALRLRTLDRTVISIPNSKVAQAGLENFSLRDQFWVHPVFKLRFDTPYSVVQKVLEEVMHVLRSRANIDDRSLRARVVQLTSSGPQIEVFAYYRKPGADYPAFLEEQEKILIEIMRVVEGAGTSLAGPIGVVRMGEKAHGVTDEQYGSAPRR